MKTAIITVFLSAICFIAYSAVISTDININAGESVNLIDMVPWGDLPSSASAIAYLSPAARVNGTGATTQISFQANSVAVVEGPTTATIVYGSPDPVTTPDAIGGE